MFNLYIYIYKYTIYIHTIIIYYPYSCPASKPPEPLPPTTGGRRQPHTLPNPSYFYCTTSKKKQRPQAANTPLDFGVYIYIYSIHNAYTNYI